MKKGILLLLLYTLQSCFPISIAPNLEKGEVLEAKKFKKQLPNQYAYIFSDPKDANEFYYFISAKFPSNTEGDSESNVPVTIDNKKYYVTFYETEKNSTAINLLPIIANTALERNNLEPAFDENIIKREGTWYIAIVITDEDYNDALSPVYLFKKDIVQFSKSLQNEYLTTSNYNSLLLKRASQGGQ